jgi:hypothetical protein
MEIVWVVVVPMIETEATEISVWWLHVTLFWSMETLATSMSQSTPVIGINVRVI